MKNFRFSPRKISLVLVAFAAVATGGCNGPTKAGQDARDAARERMGKASSLIAFDQAKQSYNSGDFDRGLKQIDEAIGRTPNDYRFWILRGRIQLEKGRLEEALKEFQRAAVVKTDCAEAYYCQGIVHERWSREDDAVEAYRKAAEIEPTKVAYLLACAEIMVAQQKYDEAKALLAPKLEYFENNAPMNQLLGQIAMLREEPAVAVQHYSRALLIEPHLPNGLDSLVRAQFAAEMWTECLANVRRLSRESEGGRTPQRMRCEGRCLAMLGRTADARNVFSELTRDAPEDVQAWIDLAAMAWQMGETTRVKVAAARLLRLAPDRYEGYVFQGLVEEQNGNADASREWFKKAAEIGGASADIAHVLSSLQDREPPTRALSATSGARGE
ncbi:MAG: tetratricopeptide repeat protein [Phycisphaerae bacterium]|nr:tetratricopeptide repeat protein [Phycisphaerae bacterium]